MQSFGIYGILAIDDQMKLAYRVRSLQKWRTAVENRLGILVFQFSMPMEEVHGFSVTENILMQL